MKKNRHKENKKKTRVREQNRELVLANRMSGSLHGGLSRIRHMRQFSGEQNPAAPQQEYGKNRIRNSDEKHLSDSDSNE